MLYIKKNTETLFAPELWSVSTLQEPFYLFELTRGFNKKDVILFTTLDLSNVKCRYNLFSINETTEDNTNPAVGYINLKSGSYTLNVYESEAPTLLISETTGISIYNGIAVVEGEDNNTKDIYK